MEERGWRSGACGTPSLPAIKKPGLALFFYWLTGSGDGPLINLPLQPGDYFVRFKIMRFGEQSDAAERAPGFTANDADTFGDGWGTPDGPASPGLDGSGGRRTGKRSDCASLMMRVCELSGKSRTAEKACNLQIVMHDINLVQADLRGSVNAAALTLQERRRIGAAHSAGEPFHPRQRCRGRRKHR